MKSKALVQAAVFCLLVAIGVVGRLVFRDTPNFTPTAAVILFAGYYFASAWVVLLVPVAVMTLSNVWLPSYEDPAVMFTVYVALLLPAVLGRLVRSRFNARRTVLAAVAPSLAFYLLTNLAVWSSASLYPHTMFGLGQCYYQALPFLRWMLEGDLLFGAVLFGSYALIRAAIGVPLASDIPEASEQVAVG